jgi:hypothetical protein
MRTPFRHLWSLVATVFALTSCGPSIAQQRDALNVTSTERAYILTVPVSRLEMRLPRSGLEKLPAPGAGSTANPRYYFFGNAAAGLLVSGWFEPASRFQGMQSFWTQETATWKQEGLPVPRDVAFKRIGNWELVYYAFDLPSGPNLHVRAHLVQLDTWIDLHISASTVNNVAPTRATLDTLLQGIEISEKAGG